MTALSILLVEDEPAAAAAISGVLRKDGNAVVVEVTGQAGVKAAGVGTFDVIILDRMLPDIGGLDIVAQLRGAGIATPILILSALARSEHRSEGLVQGADDYLGKPFEPDELIARVHALHRRAGNTVPMAVLIHGDIELHIKARTAHRAGRHLGLSPKEFELLKYLMENAGDIVTREMLLRHVWNINFDPQTNVVDVNMVRLRRKLEDGFAFPCLETVRGRGYRLTS
jgi:two-component system, OmpR family, response regulator